MFRDVIAPHTTGAEWTSIRKGIHDRIHSSMVAFPDEKSAVQAEYLAETEAGGLRIQKFRFAPLPGITTYGTMVMPAERGEAPPGIGILCCHGTDEALAHENVLSSTQKPCSPYAIELAQRGVITLAVDQFAFGRGNDGRTQAQVIDAFYRQYPQWSLDGVRLWMHQRAIDLLASQPAVDPARIGCIGHSLGGRAAAYLAAFDSRIKASVPSAGISPNLTNVFRNPPRPASLSPRLDDAIRRNGHPPFEYQELLALIAPRAVLLVEPWNDDCNPMIEPIFRCFERARFVFERCGAPESLQFLCHGDGHDTTATVRNHIYTWFLNKLAAG